MAYYLDELNDIQRAAVTTTEGPVLVIAGPGSGKTRVLTYRIAHLIEQGVAPWQILALTFTNKAAREMTERIERVVGQKARYVWAGTFHAIFARILRAEATHIGYPATFSIYDTDDTTSLLRSIIKEMSLDPQQYNPNAIRSRISLAKSNLITPQLYRANENLREEDIKAKRPYVADIYEQYVARCKRACAMDFDDLLLQMHHLLRHYPDTAQKYRERFRYLHVDEFQDTNFLQYAILHLLAKYPNSPENIFAVGDDAQSIYAFRGATIDNILDFGRDFPQLQTFKLEQNYRSTYHIVTAANELITHNQRQLKKTIWTSRTDSHKIRLLRCLTDDDEARRVADLILEQKNRFHLRNGDIAILYRTNAQSRKFEEHLRRQNLPYRVFGGLSFYQRKEVKDLLAYLRLVVNPYDEEALVRIINYPTRGISDATVDKIRQHAAAQSLPLWQAMLTADLHERARKAVLQFRAMVEEWQRRAQVETAYQIAADIYRQSGLLATLKSDIGTEEGLGRLENANAVLDAISEFCHNAQEIPLEGDDTEVSNDTSLAAYLQTVSLLTDADLADDSPDYITLMSAHAAKGLEFRSVFITGLEENLFPSYFALENPGGLDEERRLFYVAITRAKELLTLSYASVRYRNGQLRESTYSRFLNEISREHYENLGGIGSRRSAPEPARASVSGNFSRPTTQKTTPAPEPPSNFTPSPPEAIMPGTRVFHLKFGEGTVKSVDGARENRVATIAFHNDELPERRLVLRFAKLMALHP